MQISFKTIEAKGVMKSGSGALTAVWQWKHQRAVLFNTTWKTGFSWGFMFSYLHCILQLSDNYRHYIPPSLSPIPSPSLSDKAIVRWQRPFLWIKRQHTKWDHFLPIFLLLQRKSIGNIPFGSGSGSFSNFCCNRCLVCRHVDVSKAAV